MPGKITYPEIVKRFETELAELGAANVFIESGHDADDLRLDGHLKITTNPPRFPGIVVRLYAGVPASRTGDDKPLGALRIATGVYDDWQGNLWAVAMTLERLRTLAAYGTVDARALYALLADTAPDASPPAAPVSGEKPRPRPAKSKPRPDPPATSNAAPAWDATRQDAARCLLREAGEDDHFRFAVLLLKNARTARRVFIAATKNAHPDGGGSDARMRGVSEAWGVLNG